MRPDFQSLVDFGFSRHGVGYLGLNELINERLPLPTPFKGEAKVASSFSTNGGLAGTSTSASISLMQDPQFSYDMEVRDYECDLQGIVNNAKYQNYLEHARHKFLKAKGIDFAEVTARGIYLIVTRIEIDYKFPLRSGDRFRIDLNLERVSRIRFAFIQEIVRLDDEKLCIQARVITSAMNENGRPMFPKEIEAMLPEIH